MANESEPKSGNAHQNGSSDSRVLRRRIRWIILFFMVALIFSGVTAIPLIWELEILTNLAGVDTSQPTENYSGLQYWLAHVYEGLVETDANYPFIAYGSDWLAYAHFVIAIAFIGPWRDPIRNIWIIDWALIACLGVFAIAFIFGPYRGIPFFWPLIDCSFGFFGFIVLFWLRINIKRLEKCESAREEN